ncbi:MAG: hypothetical protein WD116_03685 [Chloroflexota bacterium]
MTRSPMTRRMAAALTLIAVLAVAGCTAASPSPSSGPPSASASLAPSTSPSEAASASPSAAASVPASAAPSEPTESLPAFACTPTVAIPATAERAQITDVRVAEHAGYDRVVFEFTGGIPQTLIEAVLPPFHQDGSGLPFDVNGTAFLQLTMDNASRVSPDGVVTYAGPTEFEPDLPQVVHLIEGGDFEAVSTWYLGLDGGGCLRVLTLATPSRLVIDIEH